MMEPTEIAKQMIDFNKAAFNSGFNAMMTLQDQTEKMASNLVDQASWIPAEGKKGIHEWVQACKKGRDDFKKAADENFKKVEEFLSISK